MKWGGFTSQSSHDGKEIYNKVVMHVQSRWAANLNPSVLFFFWGFRCRCRRHCFSFFISKRKSPQTDTWCQYYQRESCLYLEYNSAGSKPWDKGGGRAWSSRPLEKGGGRQAVSSKDRGGSPSLRNKRFQSSHIAWKLERKQKNGWRGRGRGEEKRFLRSPPPPPSFMFFLLLSQLSRRTSRGNACYAG